MRDSLGNEQYLAHRGAQGAAWYMPEERQITTKEAMLDEICSLLGGRAAEELFTGHISTGAINDLERRPVLRL